MKKRDTLILSVAVVILGFLAYFQHADLRDAKDRIKSLESRTDTSDWAAVKLGHAHERDDDQLAAVRRQLDALGTNQVVSSAK